MSDIENNSQGVRGIQLLLRSLRHRNYRLFFIGQGTSLLGTWMQSAAMSWLVYRITGSALLLGVVAFASQVPSFFIAPFAGVLADRWNRHRMVLGIQILAMLQALLLAILVITGVINKWEIIALSVFSGIIGGFDIPTRQAFVPELIENPEDLPNAIAMNSMIFNGARMAGGLFAGMIIAVAGEGICFGINAASYLAIIAALLLMRLSPRSIPAHNGAVLAGIKDGILYSYRVVPIRIILLMLAFIGLVGMPYAVLLPVFAKDILGGGPLTYGFLVGAVGVGALCGAIFLASRRSARGLGRIMTAAVIIFGGGVIAFSFSTVLWFSLAMLLLAGFGMMVQMASVNTILQTIVDDDKRGRVMSLYTMAFMGMAPLGSLLVGSVAHSLGAPRAMQISGILCIAAAIAFATKLPELRRWIHPIYVRKGIIPQVATGIGAAVQVTAETKE
jgi:MFS family permease